MAVATLVPVIDEVLELDELHRAWHGEGLGAHPAPTAVKDAQITVSRQSPNDFQDRQVYIYVDGEAWGKVRYGQPMTREVKPGRHTVRAFNTLCSHTIEVNVEPGAHARLRCTNGMPKAGWLMMIFLHVTYLPVRLEHESTDQA